MFDAPSLFYLSNRATIDEWASLRSNVADALGDWYRRVLPGALAPGAEARGLQISEARGPSSYHHVVLHPPFTPMPAGKPVIGIGIAWPAKSVDPAGNSTFACVRCSRNATGREAARRFLDAGGRAFRDATARAKGADQDTWPVYWWVTAGERWWTDLDAYCQLLVNEVVRMVDALRDPLDVASAVELIDADEEEA